MRLTYLLNRIQYSGQKQNIFCVFVLVFTFFIGSNSIGQVQYNLQTEVDDAKLALWANEVFNDCPEFTSIEYLDIYRKQINKVTIAEVPNLEDYYNLTDLSLVGLKNKCNYSLQHDTSVNFSVENFNPLKYFFDFYAAEDKLYRVNDTNFIITINK